MRTLRAHSHFVDGCAAACFSPSGALALSASWDGTLTLWRVAGGASKSEVLKLLLSQTSMVPSPE